MKKLDSIIDKIYKAALALSLFGIVVCVTLQIVARYLLSSPLVWTDEYSRLFFCWCTFVGAAIASREDSHLEVEFFYTRFKPGLRKAIDVINHLIICALSCAILFYSVQQIITERGARSLATRTPVSVFTFSLIVGFIGIGAYSLVNAIRYWKGNHPQPEEEQNHD